MPLPLDVQYVESLKTLNPEIISDLVRRHTDILIATARGMGWSLDEAEELVQETWVTFLSTVKNFQGRSTVRTYVTGILYNKSLERRREVVREQAADPVDEVFENRFGWFGIWKRFPKGPDEEAVNKELADMIQDCAEGLTMAQRTAFYLREVEKQPTVQICNVLDLTPTHLGVILFRARNKLRECIEKKWSQSNEIS